jgi:tetratricopeptide (TPR) repeat protein
MADAPTQMRIFVSHSHKDDAACHAQVAALRGAGADVWYDEHNMTSGRLGPTIERELRARPIFVVMLSPAALASQWVEDESRWAYSLMRKDPTRIILPVLCETVTEDDIWLFLQEFRRIEAPDATAFPEDERIQRTLRALSLTPAEEESAPVGPQPTESADDLLSKGKALIQQKKYAQAIPFLEDASRLAPGNKWVWANLGLAYNNKGEYEQGRDACEHAIALDADLATAWANKGWALMALKRFAEALPALERAVELEPTPTRLSNLAHVQQKLAKELGG